MRFGWMWIALAIIIILVVWFGGFGWGTYGGWWWGNQGHAPVTPPPSATSAEVGNSRQPAPANSPAVIGGSGLDILKSTNRQALAGRPFDITNVPVQQKSSNRAFWISANGGTPMLVVLPTGVNTPISQGIRVNIYGTIEHAPTADEAERLWSLSGGDANRLEQDGVYVQATEIQAGQR